MSPVSGHAVSPAAVTARPGRHLPVLSTGLGLGGIDVVGAEGVWFHLADGRRVIRLRGPAQGEGEEFLRQGPDEQLRVRKQGVLQAGDARELAAIGQSPGRIDRLVVKNTA